MRGLGLGLGLGFDGGRPQVSSVLDLSTLSLALWNRGSYGGSPWAGTASAGSSGSRSLTEATNPPTAGTAVNGFAPANFNGTNQQLSSALAMSNFVSSSAWATWVMFKAAAAAADAGAGGRYQNPHFWSDTSSGIGVGFSSAGIFVQQADATPAQHDVALACGTGAWHILFAWWDGSLLHVQLDTGTPTTVSCASQYSGVATATLVVGRNYNAGSFFQGDILDMAIRPTAFSGLGTDTTAIYNSLKSRYPAAGLP